MSTPRIVLITGATSGFGEATARRFAAAGWHVIATGRRTERLELLRAELQGMHGRMEGPAIVHALHFDVRDRAAVDTAIASLPPEWHAIDVLVNNAGLAAGFDPFQDGDVDDWERMLDTNVKGLLYLTRAVVPGMIARGRGHVINIGSNAGIIDLTQTVPLLHQALKSIRDVVAQGGRVLFVGTKRQASEPIADAAKRCAQYYVNHRWLSGTLTNWQTISNSIKRLRSIDEILNAGAVGLTKKEGLNLQREREKLERSLGGIKDMGGVPDLLFVIDTNKEAIAIQEANKLGIPVVAVVDSNSNPQGITFPIPGNDDASRALALYCDLVARAVIDGLSVAQGSQGVDIGASAEVPVQSLPN